VPVERSPFPNMPWSASMQKKMILLDPLKCNGCGECVPACSMKKSGVNDPSLSRIRIHGEEDLQGFYMPLTCYQCVQAPCLTVCPSEAIYEDDELDRVSISYDRCVGCKRCVAACPFGAMGFDELRGHAFKCDLCGGDPECVRSCKPGALTYVSVETMYVSRRETATSDFVKALRRRDA
jgi:carbon-monoxide dehydrogenase iron sulfur subunit